MIVAGKYRLVLNSKNVTYGNHTPLMVLLRAIKFLEDDSTAISKVKLFKFVSFL